MSTVRVDRLYTYYNEEDTVDHALIVNNTLTTTELVRSIQEERLVQAERRRNRARRHVTAPPLVESAMRMALGPGTQFAGVTERILDTVTGRSAIRETTQTM